VAREKTGRIATDAGPSAFANPFASLDLGPLREAPANAPQSPPAPKKEPRERLLLRRSTAYRGGKTVLIIEGFSTAWNERKLEALLHELKASLGCGGKIETRALELQGDQPDRLQPLLEDRGFAVKRGW